MKKLIPLTLLLASCISGRNWQTFKAHAEETGIATGGGAAAILVGGPAGACVAIAGMAVAALVGEINQPPDAEIHTTTTVDEKGHILDQKTTRTEAKMTPTEHWYDIFPMGGLWKFVYLAFAIFVLTHPKLLRKLIAGFTVAEKGMSKLYKTRTKPTPDEPANPK